MVLVISGTNLCLDPTNHTWLQSASIDGHFDTHKGGFAKILFLTFFTVASNLWRPAPWYGGVWETGDDGQVPGHTYFMPTSNSRNIAIWLHPARRVLLWLVY